ncbi:MAG: metallophosphatase family protein [Bacillus sp. (in: Bacteria)]|nr:metallophosphatase family protein [Bacillus sp. (in: firmicutes)]
MHRIAVISDTHGLLRPEVTAAISGCDAIVHGGDINKQKILDELQKTAPVYAVRGNNDKEWAKNLPQSLSLVLYGVRFFIVHNKKDIPKGLNDVDIVIYGHSHKYEEKHVDGRFFLNPGSCGPRRFTQPVTMALLEIADDASFQITKIDIPHQAAAGVSGDFGTSEASGDSKTSGADNLENEKIPENIKQIINTVMRETNRGKAVAEIAAKLNISEELTAQICRLYLTHPGVDADGIMGKMGI